MSSKPPSFRKGWDDGEWRLGWRGSSGTSRHQPLLSVATHILFLSTTLSWGQCPSWRGQGAVPECYAREGRKELLAQLPSLTGPGRRVGQDYTVGSVAFPLPAAGGLPLLLRSNLGIHLSEQNIEKGTPVPFRGTHTPQPTKAIRVQEFRGTILPQDVYSFGFGGGLSWQGRPNLVIK